MEYRLEILEERIRGKLQEVRKGGNKFNTMAAKGFLEEQEAFLAHTNQQIIPNELVPKGHIDDNISNETVKPSAAVAHTSNGPDDHKNIQVPLADGDPIVHEIVI